MNNTHTWSFDEALRNSPTAVVANIVGCWMCSSLQLSAVIFQQLMTVTSSRGIFTVAGILAGEWPAGFAVARWLAVPTPSRRSAALYIVVQRVSHTATRRPSHPGVRITNAGMNRLPRSLLAPDTRGWLDTSVQYRCFSVSQRSTHKQTSHEK